MRHRFALLFPLVSLACAPASSGDGSTSVATSSEATSASSETGSATQADSETTTIGETDSGTETTNSETDSGTETETNTGDGDGDGDPGLTECPEVEPAESAGTVTWPAIDEASGMVRSRTQELLWVHNDSGDSARLFAIGLDGSPIAIVELAGASALDWEDLAIGPGPRPGDYLYAGDIGDNAEARQNITIYQLAEPADVQAGGEPIVVTNWDALTLTYPDGPHNAETLLVDPVEGDLYIVTKGEQTRLYRLAAPLASGQLEQLPDPTYPSAIATAGDISPQGDFIMVRGYVDAFAWLRAPGQTIGDAMLAEPCVVPVANEPQGETLAIDIDGLGYRTLSEGTDQPLWRFVFAG